MLPMLMMQQMQQQMQQQMAKAACDELMDCVMMMQAMERMGASGFRV
jgi:hypothetical protein